MRQSIDLAEKWNCASHKSAMVIDTTSVNTGHLTAGCICIQEKLGKAPLCCACRKHIGEILLTNVWNALEIEATSSKDVGLFIEF